MSLIAITIISNTFRACSIVMPSIAGVSPSQHPAIRRDHRNLALGGSGRIARTLTTASIEQNTIERYIRNVLLISVASNVGSSVSCFITCS
jgi:hypothetical protein